MIFVLLQMMFAILQTVFANLHPSRVVLHVLCAAFPFVLSGMKKSEPFSPLFSVKFGFV